MISILVKRLKFNPLSQQWQSYGLTLHQTGTESWPVRCNVLAQGSYP